MTLRRARQSQANNCGCVCTREIDARNAGPPGLSDTSANIGSIALRLHCEFLEIAERKKAMECNQEKKRRVRVQKDVGCHFVSLLLLDWPIGACFISFFFFFDLFLRQNRVCLCSTRAITRVGTATKTNSRWIDFFLGKNRGCRMLSVSLTGTIQRQAKKMNRKEKNLGWLCCVCQNLEKKLVYSPSACITFFCYPFSLLCNRILLYAITQRPKMGWHTRAYPHCT